MESTGGPQRGSMSTLTRGRILNAPLYLCSIVVRSFPPSVCSPLFGVRKHHPNPRDHTAIETYVDRHICQHRPSRWRYNTIALNTPEERTFPLTHGLGPR